MIFFKKRKEKKPYKFPPNIHFYKDGEVVWKVYSDRKDLGDVIQQAKEKYDPDGYMTFAPTGRSSFMHLKTRKKKHWGKL